MAADSWGSSWGGAFTRFIRWSAVEVATVPSFGPPFIDRQCALLTTLGGTNLIVTALGVRTSISPGIERKAVVRSSRIDRALL